MISFCVILSLVWLRDQIINGGGPEWLENVQDDQPVDVSFKRNNIIPHTHKSVSRDPVIIL